MRLPGPSRLTRTESLGGVVAGHNTKRRGEKHHWMPMHRQIPRLGRRANSRQQMANCLTIHVERPTFMGCLGNDKVRLT